MIKKLLKQVFCNHTNVRVIFPIIQTGYCDKSLNSSTYKVRCERCGKIMTRKFKFKGGFLSPRPIEYTDVYNYDDSSIYPVKMIELDLFSK